MKSHWPMRKRPFLRRTPSSGSPRLVCPTAASFWTKCSGGWRLPAIRALARCARNCAAGCRNTGCDNRPMLLVTGGAGFIGSNFVLSTIAETGETLVTLDKLTYAGNLRNLDSLREDRRHTLVQGDICDREMVRKLLSKHKPRAVLHFAAESHVDRSIAGPAAFVQTNVVGTFCLLEETRSYYESLAPTERDRFRFLHVSTDEVYGSLGPNDSAFTETNRHAPNSPYAASKAASDHLVRSYHHTYGLPTLTTNCSNNYGPYQFPEKLIPLMIRNALAGKPLPVYGDGKNIRDWVFVVAHWDAGGVLLARGRGGGTYNNRGRIAEGRNERGANQSAR